MPWISADVLTEEPVEEELRIWNRADLERPRPNGNAHTRGATTERNIRISKRFIEGVTVEALARAEDLSERTVRRIVGL